MKQTIKQIHIMKIYLELEQKVPNKIDDYYIDETYYRASQMMDVTIGEVCDTTYKYCTDDNFKNEIIAGINLIKLVLNI